MLQARFVLVLCLLLPLLARGQEALRPVTGDEKAAFLRTWGARMQAMQSLHMRFTQEKQLRLLRRPLSSQGELWLKGDTLHYLLRNMDGGLELDLRLDPHTVKAYYPLLQTLEVIDLRTTSAPQHPMPFLGRDMASLEKEYDAELFAAAERYSLRLVPRDPGALLAELRLTLQDFQPQEYMQVEKNGNRLAMQIAEFTVNAEVSEAQLELHVPQGTRVTYPLR
jgi:outer membrane lipoprotein-sorting protein